MKGTLVAFDSVSGRSAAARMVDGQLDDLLIDPPDDRIRPGAIYRARARRPMKGQGGLILETPDGPLFLRQSKGISQGDDLIVQVSTYAEAGKAAPATHKLLLKSRFCLVTPGAVGLNISRSLKDEERRVELREVLDDLKVPDGIGIVVRTAAGVAEDAAVRDDIEEMLALAGAVLNEPRIGVPERLLDGPGAADVAIRDWPVPDVTDSDSGSFLRHGIDAAIASLGHAHHVLPGGASFYVEPTRALTAVDINTGSDTTPAAGLKANIAAIRALPRALRLRGLGGQIVLDLAPLAKKDRRQIEQVVKSAFRSDAIETSLVGWTPLGHLELVRKRERLVITECLS